MNSPEFYSFVIKFAEDHSFLTWCFLWLLWGPVGILLAVISFLQVFVVRTYRVLMVAFRGWPPSHLDADGDWKPQPSSGESSKPADNSKL